MQKNVKNKAISSSTDKEMVYDNSDLQTYFFPGGGVYEPITIYAKDVEEANEIYESKKVKVEKELTQGE